VERRLLLNRTAQIHPHGTPLPVRCVRWGLPTRVVWSSVAGGCFLLTLVVGAWAAYDPVLALVRFVQIGVGLALATAIVGGASVHRVAALEWAGMGCAAATILLSLGLLLGLTSNSGVIASGLMLLCPLVGGVMMWDGWAGRRLRAWLGGGALVLALVGLIASGERTVWLSLAVGFASGGLLALWGDVRRPQPLRWAVIAFAQGGLLVGLCVYGLILVDPAVAGWLRTAPFLDGLLERTGLWRESLALVGDYRFTGGGLGATALLYSTYVYLVHVPYAYHAHNLYLQIGLEQGVLGLVSGWGIWMSSILAVIQCYHSLEKGERWLGLATFSALVAVAFYGLLDADLYAGWMATLLFLPCGFALALPWVSKSKTHDDSNSIGHALLTGLLGVPMVLLLGWLLWPGSGAHLHANLGAVAQTRAELRRYAWPAWPIQDALRRSPAIDLSTAIAHYRAALALDNANITAHARLGQIALSRGEYGRAFEHLRSAYAVAPQRMAVRLLLGEVSAIQGAREQAVTLWQALGPDHTEAFQERVWWYQQRNASREAERLAELLASVKQVERQSDQ
jgi:tetratricopeptide (TPR) repeat protein